MYSFDLSTPSGQQEFEKYIVMMIRNEINSYARQVLVDKSATTNVADGSTLTDAQRIARLEQAVFRG